MKGNKYKNYGTAYQIKIVGNIKKNRGINVLDIVI